MRYVILFLISMLMHTLYAQDMEALIKGERAAYEGIRNFKSKRTGSEYDVTYQKMTLDIVPSVRYIVGNIYTELTVLEDNATQIAYDLTSNMIVDSVWVDGQRITGYSTTNNAVTITIPISQAGDRLTTTVYYRGDPSKSDQRAFTFDNQPAGPIAWTLSQPYGAYGWWPCKQQLYDKIDSFDMEITIPEGNMAAGLGTLEAVDTLADNSLVYHWKHRYPVATYLVAVAVTNYYEESHYIQLSGGDSVYMLDYIYPTYKSQADTLRWEIDGMMRGFDSLFGDYPFKDEKYGHAMFTRGGGMEHQTMSFMASLNFDLMAHELGHQWFGDKITCGSWEDLWLNEGWATYTNAIARELVKPKAFFHEFLRESITRTIRNDGGSVYAYDTSNVNVLFSGDIRYRKGSAVLHQLRWEVGDSAFFAGTRNYLADADLCYGFAYTQDFQDAIEASSGLDLDPFFDRYVYKEGFPILTTRWNRISDSKIRLTINQSTSHPSVSFFPLTIQMRAVGAGRDSLFTIDHSTIEDIIVVDLGFKVRDLEFDPNYWLITKNTLIEGSHIDLANVNVYPNPSSNSISVFVNGRKLDKIELLDMQGRVIRNVAVEELKSDATSIKLDGLANGIYFVRAIAGGEAVVVKFAKVHN
jgi:aminopeptidase N